MDAAWVAITLVDVDAFAVLLLVSSEADAVVGSIVVGALVDVADLLVDLTLVHVHAFSVLVLFVSVKTLALV